jgi:hypothetical protein
MVKKQEACRQKERDLEKKKRDSDATDRKASSVHELFGYFNS